MKQITIKREEVIPSSYFRSCNNGDGCCYLGLSFEADTGYRTKEKVPCLDEMNAFYAWLEVKFVDFSEEVKWDASKMCFAQEEAEFVDLMKDYDFDVQFVGGYSSL